MSAAELSDKLEINPMTCWKFRKKIRQCVQRQQENPNDDVDIMEILKIEADSI